MKPMSPEDLSRAVSSAKEKAPVENKMPKEEQIGFHKGSLNTLVSERNELVKIIANVEAIMKAHIDALKNLGVKMQ